MLIQIVTAVLNPGPELELTAQSILKQTYKKWKWIIKSTGGESPALVCLAAINDPRIHFIHGDDHGIYDAWNIALAQHEANWTLFLGSGDTLSNDTVLEEVASQLTGVDVSQSRIAFGHARITASNGSILGVHRNNWASMKGSYRYGKPALPIHPEVFHSRGLLAVSSPFDTTCRIAADVDIMLRALAINEPIELRQFVTNVKTGGTSQDPNKSFKIYTEVLYCCAKNGIRVPMAIKSLEYMRVTLKMGVHFILKPRLYQHLKERLLPLIYSR